MLLSLGGAWLEIEGTFSFVLHDLLGLEFGFKCRAGCYMKDWIRTFISWKSGGIARVDVEFEGLYSQKPVRKVCMGKLNTNLATLNKGKFRHQDNYRGHRDELRV